MIAFWLAGQRTARGTQRRMEQVPGEWRFGPLDDTRGGSHQGMEGTVDGEVSGDLLQMAEGHHTDPEKEKKEKCSFRNGMDSWHNDECQALATELRTRIEDKKVP